MIAARATPYTAYENTAGARAGIPGRVPRLWRNWTTRNTTVAPTAEPHTEPSPPTVAMIRNSIDRTSGNEPGAMYDT